MNAPATASAWLADIFGPEVASAHVCLPVDVTLLSPLEAACATGFAPARLADFAAGRLCARAALGLLGVRDFSLVVAPDRQPRWPRGIVGSISHSDGRCVAVVVPRRVAAGIGVDIERTAAVTRDLDAVVFTDRERAALSNRREDERGRAAGTIFSAKEASYKCWSSLCAVRLDFQDVEVVLHDADAKGGTFEAHCRPGVIPDGHTSTLNGRFAYDGSFVATGVTTTQPASLSGGATPSASARSRKDR